MQTLWGKTCSYVKNINKIYEDMITKYVSNIVLHHFSMTWIIGTNQQLEYDINKHNPYWITDGLQYNTSICTKLHGIVFEIYTIKARSDIYNIMCSIDAHEK